MSRRAAVLLGLFGLFGLLVGNAPLSAQLCQVTGPAGTCSVNVTMSYTIPIVLRLQVSGSTTTMTVNEATYDAGGTTTPTTGPTVTASSNSAWRVQMSSSNTFWTAVNTDPGAPARTTKPLSDLQWSKTSGGTYTAFSAAAITLASGASATASTATSLFFKSTWSYATDTPGAYSVPITFTILSP